eukprot:scaffold33526_cov153-Skeletonema_dohrnii-CCMP3373.AAC.1
MECLCRNDSDGCSDVSCIKGNKAAVNAGIIEPSNTALGRHVACIIITVSDIDDLLHSSSSTTTTT